MLIAVGTRTIDVTVTVVLTGIFDPDSGMKLAKESATMMIVENVSTLILSIVPASSRTDSL
jgi:hypothetical protein